jgi:crescentin
MRGNEMENSWGFIKRRFKERDREELGAATAAAQSQTRSEAPDGFSPAPPDQAHLLDAIGQQDEMIRVRISHLANRLEDVASLKSDFSSLIEPISSFAAEYPRLRVKLAETEAILQDERETNAHLGRELRTLNAENLRLGDELSTVSARQSELAELARNSEAMIETIRRSLKEKETLVGELERQLFAEQERARAIFDENQALRAEVQAADLAASRQEGDLSEARQTIALLEHDNRALRSSSSEQAQRLAAVNSAYGEIEQQFRGMREKLAQVEAQLAAEQNLRHRLETLNESERSTYQSNVASLEMKVDGLVSRLSVTEKILNQARDEVRKKTEELRTVERIAKDASTEKNTLERRFEAVQNEMRELSGSRAEAERAAAELLERCEVLTRALDGKEAALAKAEHRSETLLARIEKMTKEHEAERASLEAHNHRLAEELKREMSEKALAQGALETARRSRVEIHKQFLKIKKMHPASEDGRGDSLDSENDRPAMIERNVSRSGSA